TAGKPKVVAIVTAPDFDEAQVVRWAASVEQASEHPLAFAIGAAARERRIDLASVSEFNSPSGKGVVGAVEGHRLALGSSRFLHELSVDVAALAADAERLRRDGATTIFLAVDGQPAAVLAIADPIKPTTPAAIADLGREGVRIVMLT